MGLIEAIKTGLRKSFQFSGRTTRTEFWWFAPLGFAASIAIGSLLNWDAIKFVGIWQVGAAVITSFPLFVAMSRRLHDTDRHGSYLLVPIFVNVILIFGLFSSSRLFNEPPSGEAVEALQLLQPEITILVWLSCVASFVILLVMLCRPSSPGPNRYGPNPLEVIP